MVMKHIILTLAAFFVATFVSSAAFAQAACTSHGFLHITTATDTLAVEGKANRVIRICGYKATFAGTATVYLESATDTGCASGFTQLTGVDSGVAQSVFGFYNPVAGGLQTPSGNALCVHSTGTGGVDVDIWFLQ